MTPTDLEVNRNGESSLQLIFARGIKGDFYDTEINYQEDKIGQMGPEELAN